MTVDRVRILETSDHTAWEQFARGCAEATLYQTPRWCDFITDVFGHRAHHLIAERDSGISGVLPLFLAKAPFVGKRLISLPYDLASGGPLAKDDAAAAALVTEAMRLATERKVDFLELRLAHRAAALDALGLTREDLILISTLPLRDAETTWRAVSKRNLKSFRAAARRGIVVRSGETGSDFLAFYRIYLRTFRDFGTPPYPRRYFIELHERFQAEGAAQLLLASVNGRIVGGKLCFFFGGTLVSKFTVALKEALPLRAYPALFGAAIDLGIRLGAHTLSWGGSGKSQAGLIDFKQRWGSESEVGVRYSLAVRRRAPDLQKYLDSSGFERRAWRHLPLGVTAKLGGVLNRWFC